MCGRRETCQQLCFWGPAGEGAGIPGSSSERQPRPPIRQAGCPDSCLVCMKGHLGQGLEMGGLEECCGRVGWMLLQVFRDNSISCGVEAPGHQVWNLLWCIIRDESPVPIYLRKMRTRGCPSDEPGGPLQVAMPSAPLCRPQPHCTQRFPPPMASKLLMSKT